MLEVIDDFILERLIGVPVVMNVKGCLAFLVETDNWENDFSAIEQYLRQLSVGFQVYIGIRLSFRQLW